MTEPGTELILVQPSGELVDPRDTQACFLALREVNRIQGLLYEAKRALTAALVVEAQRRGERTVTLESGERYVAEGGPSRQYRPEDVEEGLRAAGMPEERIAQIVVTEVSRKVNGVEANKAARANPAYAAALEEASEMVEARYSVKVSRA